LKEEERVERRKRGTKVAQQLDPELDDEGRWAKRLGVDQAVIGGIRLAEFRKPLARTVVCPIKVPCVHHDAADRGAVPADPLGCRMDDDIRPVVDRPAEEAGSTKRIVDDERY